MAQQNARHKFGDKRFPILYERGYLQVYTNPAGELFLEHTKKLGVSMRIDPANHDGIEFTTDARVEPIRVSNMIGWRVGPR